MARMIQCVYLKREAPGLQPVPKLAFLTAGGTR